MANQIMEVEEGYLIKELRKLQSRIRSLGGSALLSPSSQPFQHQIHLLELISSLSRQFIALTPEKITQGISETIRILGNFFTVDRVAIFRISENGLQLDTTHEWCISGVENCPDIKKSTPLDNIRWVLKKLHEHDNLRVTSIEELPSDTKQEKRWFSERSVKSSLIVPILYMGKLIGMCAFESVHTERIWNNEEQSLLKIASEVIAGALAYHEDQMRLALNERFLASVFDSIQDGICVLDTNMVIIRVNRTMEIWYESFLPLVGRKCHEVYHGFSTPCENCPTMKVLASGNSACELVPKRGKDREIIGWFDLYAFPLFSPNSSKIIGVIEYVRDATERIEAQNAARERAETLQGILRAAPMGIGLVTYGERNLQWINDRLSKIVGYSEDELIGRNASILYENTAEFERVGKVKYELLKKNGIGTLETRWKCKDGTIKQILLSSAPIDTQDYAKGIIFTARDITEQKATEEALRNSEFQYRTTIDALGDPVHVVDRGLTVLLTNFSFRAWMNRLGFSTNMIGKNIFDIFPFLPQAVREEYQRVFDTGNIEITEETNDVKGAKIITETRKIPIFDHGDVVRVITVIRDITQRKEAESARQTLTRELKKTNERLRALALRDPGTGLFNHRYLAEVIEAEFDRARRSGHSLSVIMLDVDYFKSINDMYGHQFGDLVLRQLAAQLKKMVRRYDIVIRFGGEEFLIISPGTEKSTALTLAHRLLDAINLYNFGNSRHAVKLKISIAVVSYPEDRIVKGIGLIDLADKVLNKAKEAGGDRVYSVNDFSKKRKAGSLSKEKDDVGILKNKLEKLTRKTNQSLIESIFAFSKTIELKDHYTGEHVEKTVFYATEIARVLGLQRDEVERIKQAAILHDLGKIGISERILLKKSKLTAKEFSEITHHPQIAADILRPIQSLHGIIPFILHHHERWDGKGYPDRLKGEEIPIGARIIAIADVYQALTSDRPYRKAYSASTALEMIKKGSGSQFDPKVVAAFLEVLDDD